MKILSCFDGMSCGQIALNQLGIPVSKYYSSEVDKHSQAVTKFNFPDTVFLGDITKWKDWKIEKPDLIIGGSPCQGFSFAGKRLNFDDPRSKLFFVFAEIIKHFKPKYFLLENVIMDERSGQEITKILGVNPVIINSSLVSAQNRKRIYWTNIPGYKKTLFGSVIGQPEDRKIYLKDVIESGTADIDKSYCIDANYFKGGSLKNYKEKKRRQLIISGPINLVEKRSDEAKKIRSENIKAGKDFNPFRKKELHCREDGKVNCLQTALTNDHIIAFDNITWRKLTPIECERLQTVTSNKKYVIMGLCLDQIKNFVSVVNKSHKLQKLVSSAEKLELKDYVKHVIGNMNASRQSKKNIALKNAGTPIEKQIKECTNPNLREKNISADSVGKKIMCSCQNTEGGSVILNAFINIIEGRITHCGKGVFPLIEKNLAVLKNGKNVSSLSGGEIMQLVKIVEKNLFMKKNNNSTSTILNHLDMKVKEQILIILYWFAESATTGSIHQKIKKINLSFKIEDGYTKFGIINNEKVKTSNTQRYKMLGNGWTVEVIKHIFKELK